MVVENYSIPKGKILFEEIITIAEKEKLFHAQIVGARGRINNVKIVPTNFNTRDIDPEQEFGIGKFSATIKKTVGAFSIAPVKASIFRPENPKIVIEGELKGATTASEITIDVSKHDLSKIIS